MLGEGVLCFCILKELAACMYRSAASWYLTSRPPKKLKPLEALERLLSACDSPKSAWLVEARGHGKSGTCLLEESTRVLRHVVGVKEKARVDE